MSTPRVLTVRQVERGTSLEQFLIMRLGVSRKQAKRMLDERRVFVNGKRIWMARHELRSGDEVETPPAPGSKPASPRPATLRVIYEDSLIFVVDKPAGLLSTGPDSVESRLRAMHPEILPVHRLDRETSGCLMFARTPESQATMEKEFEGRRVEKVYQAIAIGLFPPTLTKLERPVGGLTALTEFRIVRRNPVASHIEARPRTGRTHQIRVHLQQAGFPLAGDRMHSTRAVKDELIRQLPRQMLHAWRLSWNDPVSGERKKAQATPPVDFRDTLVALRLAPLPKRGGGR